MTQNFPRNMTVLTHVRVFFFFQTAGCEAFSPRAYSTEFLNTTETIICLAAALGDQISKGLVAQVLFFFNLIEKGLHVL